MACMWFKLSNNNNPLCTCAYFWMPIASDAIAVADKPVGTSHREMHKKR